LAPQGELTFPARGEVDDEARQEREVRLTAQRRLTRHLRPCDDGGQPVDTFWAGISLDLTDATLIDFSLRHCHVNEGWFNGAKFVGYAGFGEVKFTGGAGFREADFTGNAWFDRADFVGNAWFTGAKFAETTRFDGADFGGDALFNRAKFVREATFLDARFAGDVPPEVTSYLAESDDGRPEAGAEFT